MQARRIRQLAVRVVAGAAVVAGLLLAAGCADAVPYTDYLVQEAAAGTETGNGAK